MWRSARSCSKISCKANAALSLRSSGLVLVTDAIAGMGLAPGRHTLGQQVVEIDGLNTYIAGQCLFAKELGAALPLVPVLESPAHRAAPVSVRQRLCHPRGFWCLMALQ